MKNNQTVTAFAQGYLKLSQHIPLSKISVSMVTQECGMSRKSFYYYFNDRESLVVWIFRNDLSEILMDADTKKHMLLRDNTGMAYYPNLELDSPLTHYRFLDSLLLALEKHLDFYEKALQETQPGNLNAYIHNLYRPLFTTILYRIHAIKCPTYEFCQLMVDLYLGAITTFLRTHVSELNERNHQQYLNALYTMANSCFMSKSLRCAS